MYNWSTDTTRLQRDSEKYKRWKLEQLINYGLSDEKLDTKDLSLFLDQIIIDPRKKRYLEYLLYGKKPTN